MRTLYLIRHGRPREGRICGRAQDVPLSEAGLRQAAELGIWARKKPLTAIYTSPALRCRQTAGAMAGDRLPVQVEEGLAEVDIGGWSSSPSDEMGERWPAEYERRRRELDAFPPPEGESFAQAGERMERTVAGLLSRSQGDVAVVAHSGASRGWLCRLLGRSANQALTLPQPWGGITEIVLDEGRRSVLRLGVRPRLWPDAWEIEALWDRYGTPTAVRAHCQAVAQRAMELAEQSGQLPDRGLLNAACLLHDLVRDWPDHAHACGEIMAKEGWPELGAVIAVHHDLPKEAGTEACLLYLADKLVQGDRPVSLEERFESKRALCGMPEVLAAWERRHQRARQAAKQLGLEV